MRSVMVTKFVPLPANSGGKLRSLAVLRRLASLGDVTLCCFEDSTGNVDALREMGVDVRTVPWRPTFANTVRGIARTRSGSAGRFWDRRLADEVRRALAERPPDLLQVEYSQLARYLELGDARTRVLDFHNIESQLAMSFARSARTPKARLARLESVLLRRLERRGAERADLVTVVSEQDRDRMPGKPRRMLVCPNGWDPEGPLAPSPEPVAVFVALMGWKPNVDAAVWLAQHVWPHVRAQMPEARLVLVGREPAPEVRALAAPDVEVTGTVPDVRPYLARARVALAPLLSGGGTRLKVLEALDAGRPLVSTSVGIDGLTDLVGHGALVADDPQRFAERIVELLQDPGRAKELGVQGSAAVGERYAWDKVLQPWLDVVTQGDS
ncbi:MAG: glycosyltransferase family 4 protein [Actinomycetes bacterium]